MGDREWWDLEGSTTRAWTRFQARLGDRLVEMGHGDVVVIDVETADEEDAAAPCLRFTSRDDGARLRGEITASRVAGRRVLEAPGADVLLRQGWHVPTPEEGDSDVAPELVADVPAGEADRLAVMATRALRDVLGVTHPAFLAAGGLEVDPDAPAALPVETVADTDEPVAVMPDDAEHLRVLVDTALTPLFGEPPTHDGDGDVPVPWGSSLVYVRVDDERPVVEIFGFAALEVTDLERAAFEVNVLNRDERFLKFTLVEDRVMARIHLPAWPFVPEHLRSMLTLMSARLDQIDEDLVARVGGRRAVDLATDPADAADDGVDLDLDLGAAERPDEGLDEDLDEADGPDVGSRAADSASGPHRRREAALLTLLQLDADAVGSVDPELAASICDFDRDLVVHMLGDTGRQETAWHDARDRARRDGDADEARACAHEAAAWERTTTLLRHALRLIVERDLGRSPALGTRPAGAAPRGRSRRRVAPKRLPPRPGGAAGTAQGRSAADAGRAATPPVPTAADDDGAPARREAGE